MNKSVVVSAIGFRSLTGLHERIWRVSITQDLAVLQPTVPAILPISEVAQFGTAEDSSNH